MKERAKTNVLVKAFAEARRARVTIEEMEDMVA
jgi:hypothetical protein